MTRASLNGQTLPPVILGLIQRLREALSPQQSFRDQIEVCNTPWAPLFLTLLILRTGGADLLWGLWDPHSGLPHFPLSFTVTCDPAVPLLCPPLSVCGQAGLTCPSSVAKFLGQMATRTSPGNKNHVGYQGEGTRETPERHRSHIPQVLNPKNSNRPSGVS